VTDVVDGDTIRVSIGGTTYTVRYIGIDTPETVDPNSPVMWMGPEASAANRALVAGKDVVLERDVSETDRFGRLLRYVWLSTATGWLLINEELVLEGYATPVSYPPDVRYQDLFIEAQQDAVGAGRGLWGPTPTPAHTPTPAPPPPVAPPPPASNCSPSYPGVCIPPPPPDLDCGDVAYRRFQVLAPDPHNFDGDHDGIGCEG
jgi:micrococcal nuclease